MFGGHPFPAQAGGLSARFQGRESSCEKFLREAARVIPPFDEGESDFNGLARRCHPEKNRQLQMKRKIYPRRDKQAVVQQKAAMGRRLNVARVKAPGVTA
jgi:hypothetical protein